MTGAGLVFSQGLILGIETSCDETAVAVVEAGVNLRSNVVASQVEMHAPFGGVVPEIAGRAHLEALDPVLRAALAEASTDFAEIDAVAVARGPGLAGALMVGMAAAKAIAVARRIPFVAVNHLEGHLFAVLLDHPEFEPPAVVVLASGGHTMLVHMAGWGAYSIIGSTLDDAAGEAFDKVGRYIGLGFPGGPAIDRAARDGNADRYVLPRAMLADGFDFSLSGLKTAVVLKCRAESEAGREIHVADMAASFQEAVVDVIVAKAVRAAAALGVGRIAMGGGVAANSRLRERMRAACESDGIDCLVSSPSLCTDNAAMIAAAGAYRLAMDGPGDLGAAADPALLAPFVFDPGSRASGSSASA